MTPNCPKDCPALSHCQETENVEHCMFYMQGHNIDLADALTKTKYTSKQLKANESLVLKTQHPSTAAMQRKLF